MEIRALREDDEHAGFRSGNDSLDRFFREFAGQNQFRHHLGVTYVAAQATQILGYATVSPGHLEIEGLPAVARRKLSHYPIPVLRLARLAVEVSAQGQGVGSQLLRFVLQLALGMDEKFGCAGVMVDAKPEAVDFYGTFGFIMLDAVEGLSDARPQPRAMFLAIRAIGEAAGGFSTR
jgi:GNAT superfamily N-acetyltransferase